MSETSKYTYTLGRRKTSVVTVRLFEKAGDKTFNKKDVKKVYPAVYSITQINKPFTVCNLDPDKFSFTAVSKGGGRQSQLEALQLALSRALVQINEAYKPLLRAEGLLTRDPRMVERKKAGLRKARKAEQYSKR